jgi:F-type H+-transporting ATPase subunit delta
VNADKSARDYAGGFVAAALENWTNQLNAVADALDRGSILQELDDSRRDFAARRKTLASLLPANLDKLETDLLSVLLANGDLGKLREIVLELRGQLERGALGPQVAEIKSAQPLADSERQALREKLTADFGEDLEFDFQVDPAIIGGLVIRVGDKLIDSSIATRLNRMRDQLASVVR